MKIEAAYRLQAAIADRKQAIAFLTELGFEGLRFKSEREDEIKFFYTDYDKAKLTRHLGKPKPAEKSIRYNFGTQGVVAIWEKNDTVILKNSKRSKPGAPLPPEPKAPEPEKVHEPRTGTENDDDHVPVIHITPELHAEYQMAQRNEMYRLKFLRDLWQYLNHVKFGTAMRMPNIRLMKNVRGASFRMRGYWMLRDREFAISKRLFNATQNFFVEVVLHEMCHQAVSEIDNVWDKSEGGHGVDWQRWMRKVGLNPRRFDPNENTTYMNTQEKRKHDEILVRREQALEEIKKENLQRMHLRDRSPTVTTVLWAGDLYDGIAIYPAVQSGAKWAFMSFDDLNSYRSGSIQWKIVPAAMIFAPRIHQTTGDKEKITRILTTVISHYQGKKERRQDKAFQKRMREWQ